MMATRSEGYAPRLGGEIPALCDQFVESGKWPSNWLPFSHGRAALAWLAERHSVRSALVCAYFCSSVAALFRGKSLVLDYFDIGASIDEIAELCKHLQGPRLVVVPALFGAAPWLDPTTLAGFLDDRDVVVLDAGQTAFGHLDFPVPPRGAVLSCPRKTTSLSDGAVLAVAEEIDGLAATRALPVARLPLGMKATARALWATEEPKLEEEAARWHRLAENSWPDTPHRMSDQSRRMLMQLDTVWHATMRRANRSALLTRLRRHFLVWKEFGFAPFSLPIFVYNRDATVDRLQELRIFASALWHDTERDRCRHPAADWCARHVIAVSVDQRHRPSDMLRIAEALNSSAEPAIDIPTAFRPFVTAASEADGAARPKREPTNE